MSQSFLSDLTRLDDQYQLVIKPFNIFTVLHKSTDERRLHSRFISSLLNPKGSHNYGDTFLRKFANLLEIVDFEFVNIKVDPNEDKKSEWENVDIYIRNGHSAIVIENKIFAGDSNKTLVDGNKKAQLLNYYDKVASDLALDSDLARDNIFLVYLTLNGKSPSLYDQFSLQGLEVKKIDYIQFIPTWLNECLIDLPDSSLTQSILQYKELIQAITNDFELTMKLRELIETNLEEAYDLIYSNQRSELVIRDFVLREFKHVKWHTVHEFWQSLKQSLFVKFNEDINVIAPKDDLITTVTHTGTKRNLVMQFSFKGKLIYISNDGKGFTWGIMLNSQSLHESMVDTLNFNIEKDKVWKELKDADEVVFSNFGNRDTFELINGKNREELVDRIASEVFNEVGKLLLKVEE